MSKIISLPVIQIQGTALFPNTVLPIYITHPNLISMIKEIITNDDGGLVIIRMEESINFAHHGCICGAGAPIILEELENGHLKVAIHGLLRVKILNILQDLPYQIAEVIPIADTQDTSCFLQSEIFDLRELLIRWLVQYVRNSREREIFIETLTTVKHYIDYLSMFLIKDLEIKQTLLATPCLRERINILNLVLKDNLSEGPDHDYPPLFKEDSMAIDILKDFADLGPNLKIGH